MSLKVTLRFLVDAIQTVEADGGPKTGVHKYDTGEIRWQDGIGYDEADLVDPDNRTGVY